MRSVLCTAVLTLAAAYSSPAAACSVHTPKTMGGPKKPATPLAKVEPARILLYRIDLDGLTEKLQALGHRVDLAADPDALEALLRRGAYDIAIVPLSDARTLLDDIRLGMIVPLVKESDDSMLAREFLFNVPSHPSAIADQVKEIHRALTHLPAIARR